MASLGVRRLQPVRGRRHRARFAPVEPRPRRPHDPRRRGRRVRRRRDLGGDSRHQRERGARISRRPGPTTFFLSRAIRSRSRPATARTTRASGGTTRTSTSPTRKLLNALPIDRAPPRRSSASSKEVRYKDRVLSSTQVIGATANWTISRPRGRSLSRPQLHRGRGDERRARRRSSTTRWRRSLFGDSDPLDKVIDDRRRRRSRVIGIYHYEASFLTGGNRPRAIVPFETAYRVAERRRSATSAIAIVPRDDVTRDEAMDDVIAAMRARHGAAPGVGQQLRDHHAGQAVRDATTRSSGCSSS